MRAGTGILLISAPAVFRFALATGSPHGLNLHIVRVSLILAGVPGLLLPSMAQDPTEARPAAPLGPSQRPRRPWPGRAQAGQIRGRCGGPGERQVRQPECARTPEQRSVNVTGLQPIDSPPPVIAGYALPLTAFFLL